MQIAEAFSTGKFEKTYPNISDNIEWSVINNYDLNGKKDVNGLFEKVAEYFRSIATDFQQLDVIENDHKLAITGTTEFSKKRILLESISACDAYQFTDIHMI